MLREPHGADERIPRPIRVYSEPNGSLLPTDPARNSEVLVWEDDLIFPPLIETRSSPSRI